MKAGGVSRFVVVIGHQAYSVMDCLDGVEGVVYAYQKEQKGTGHAALIGLKALKAVGYTGPVIISMGDKIIASHVIRGLLEKAGTAKAVYTCRSKRRHCPAKRRIRLLHGADRRALRPHERHGRRTRQ